MTDQEQKGNTPSAAGSAVVIVEKTSVSRHKAFRPTELENEAPPVESHHKRSRAPAVPSVAEEFKDSTEHAEIREQKESELAMTSETKHPRRRASKKSSKRERSPEAMAMEPIEVDVQKVVIVPPATQPIPAQVEPDVDISGSKEMIDNDDSITEEIPDLRNAASSNKEWDPANCSQKCVPEKQEAEDTIPQQRKLTSEISNKIMTSTKRLKKKELTWTHSTYLEKVQLQNFNTQSVAWMLDRRASVGPCFRKTLPYGEPAGIAICLPKKSVKSFNENILKPSKSGGINITVSKRCLDNNAKLSSESSDYQMRIRTDRVVMPRKENKLDIKIEEGNCANFLDIMKGKLDNWRGRIKHVLHM